MVQKQDQRSGKLTEGIVKIIGAVDEVSPFPVANSSETTPLRGGPTTSVGGRGDHLVAVKGLH